MYYYKLYNRKQKIIFRKYHQTDICLETIFKIVFVKNLLY